MRGDYIDQLGDTLSLGEDRQSVSAWMEEPRQWLVNFEKRKADLIAEMKEADRAGDRILASQIAIALGEIEDQLTPKRRVPNRWQSNRLYRAARRARRVGSCASRVRSLEEYLEEQPIAPR